MTTVHDEPPRRLSIDEVRELIREHFRGDPGGDDTRWRGISPLYVGEVLAGNREPGPRLLDALGVTREVIYWHAQRPADPNAMKHYPARAAGGHARKIALTPERRREISIQAVKARWARSKQE